MVLIRDLSVYDYLSVPYKDYDGLVIRCYNGSVKDTRFDFHKAGAMTAGKPWWAYSFYNFNYPAYPQVEAVINILKNDPGALPVAFDVEEWSIYHYPPRDELLTNLKVLHDRWYSFDGDHCQFYMNPATIHYLKPIPDWLLQCPLWLAHWGVNTPDFEPWGKWTFWQYAGEPDLNRFNGTDTEYWEFVKGEPSPPLPDKVRVTANSLYIRKTPNPLGTIIGYMPYDFVVHVTGSGVDGAGKLWYQSGANGYFASWWTEEV